MKLKISKILNKNSILIWMIFFVFFSNAQNSKNDSYLKFNKLDRFLTSKEMSDDLSLFYNIRKQVNSGLYVYRSKKEIDSIYNWAFEEIKKPMKVTDFFKIVSVVTDFEGSLHNHTVPKLELLESLNDQKTFFPFPLKHIEGKIIFDAYHEKISPGSRILSINGVKDTDLMKSFYKYFTTDGYNTTYKVTTSIENSFGWQYVMEYGLNHNYIIEYTLPKSDKKKKLKIDAVTLNTQAKNYQERYSQEESNYFDYKKQPAYDFKMISADCGLLNLRWFGMATDQNDPKFEIYVAYLDSVFKLLNEKKINNLIIDVRNNPGGSNPNFEQPMRYLTNSTFKENTEAYIIFNPKSIPFEKYFWGITTKEKMDSLSVVKGKEFLMDYFQDFKNGKSHQKEVYNPVYEPKEPLFKGDVYLLINEKVASAASHFVSLFKGYANNATIVGVETVGGYYVHNGHIPLVYELPNSGIKTQFSVVYVVQDAPNKTNQPFGRGVIPDYEIWPKFEDFIEKKDTQMEYIFKLIEKKKHE